MTLLTFNSETVSIIIVL